MNGVKSNEYLKALQNKYYNVIPDNVDVESDNDEENEGNEENLSSSSHVPSQPKKSVNVEQEAMKRYLTYYYAGRRANMVGYGKQEASLNQLKNDLTGYTSQKGDDEGNKRIAVKNDLLKIVDGTYFGKIADVIRDAKQSKKLNKILIEHSVFFETLQELQTEQKLKFDTMRESGDYSSLAELAQELDNHTFDDKQFTDEIIKIIDITHEPCDIAGFIQRFSRTLNSDQFKELFKKYSLIFWAAIENQFQSSENRVHKTSKKEAMKAQFHKVTDRFHPSSVPVTLTPVVQKEEINNSPSVEEFLREALALSDNQRLIQKQRLVNKVSEVASQESPDSVNDESDDDDDEDDGEVHAEINQKKKKQSLVLKKPVVNEEKETMKKFLRSYYARETTYSFQAQYTIVTQLKNELSVYHSSKEPERAVKRKKLRDSLLQIVEGTYFGRVSDVLAEAKQYTFFVKLLKKYSLFFEALEEILKEEVLFSDDVNTELTEWSWAFDAEFITAMMSIIQKKPQDKSMIEFITLHKASLESENFKEFFQPKALMFWTAIEKKFPALKNEQRSSSVLDQFSAGVKKRFKKHNLLPDVQPVLGQLSLKNNNETVISRDSEEVSINVSNSDTESFLEPHEKVEISLHTNKTAGTPESDETTQCLESTGSGKLESDNETTISSINDATSANSSLSSLPPDGEINYNESMSANSDPDFIDEQTRKSSVSLDDRGNIVSHHNIVQSDQAHVVNALSDQAENANKALQPQCEVSQTSQKNDNGNSSISAGTVYSLVGNNSNENLGLEDESRLSEQRNLSVSTNRNSLFGKSSNTGKTSAAVSGVIINQESTHFDLFDKTRIDKATLVISRQVLQKCVEEYGQKKHRGGWFWTCQYGSATIKKLFELLKETGDDNTVSLERIQLALHRKKEKFTQGGKDANGTNFVLNLIQEAFAQQINSSNNTVKQTK